MSKVAVRQFFSDFSQTHQKQQILCQQVTSPADFVCVGSEYGYDFTENELREELDEVWERWQKVEVPPGSGSSEAFIRELFELLKETGKI
jgi:hypothetical protein